MLADISESHDIEATASWKRLSDSIYEVKANVTSGYPRPFITHLKCNDKEVNTTTTGSTAGECNDREVNTTGYTAGKEN